MGKSKSRSSPASVWQPQADALTGLYGRGEELLNHDPLNSNQMQANNMALGYAGSDQLSNVVGGTQNALNFALDPNNINNNPYFEGAVNAAIRPVTQNFQENVLSGNDDAAMSAGQFGSSRHGVADAIAGRDYMNQVGDISSQMAFNNYSAGMDRMGNAVNQAQGVANLGMLPSNILNNVGTTQQNAPWQQLQNYKGLVGNPTSLGGASKSTGDGSQQAELALGAMMLMSDRRLKKNIKQIGKYENGLNKYSFDYVWGEHSEGAMADEVEKVIPNAVFTHSSGYKMVDYSQVGV